MEVSVDKLWIRVTEFCHSFFQIHSFIHYHILLEFPVFEKYRTELKLPETIQFHHLLKKKKSFLCISNRKKCDQLMQYIVIYKLQTQKKFFFLTRQDEILDTLARFVLISSRKIFLCIVSTIVSKCETRRDNIETLSYYRYNPNFPNHPHYCTTALVVLRA